MKRYFIVFYTASTHMYGHMNMWTENLDGGDPPYLSRKRAIDIISKDIGRDKLVLTNIIELSKQEYDDWND